MKRCHERRIGVVPQGGNTGLVGGSVPLRDELILSLNNMAKVRSFDPMSGASRISCSSVSAYFIPMTRSARGRCWMHSRGTQ